MQDSDHAIHKLQVAAGGTGAVLEKMLEVDRCVLRRSFGPGLELAGVVDDAPSPDAVSLLSLEGVSLYNDVSALLAETPGVSLFFDLYDECERSEAFRDSLPVDATVLGRREALAFFGTMVDLCCPEPVDLGKPRAKEYLAAVLDGLEEDILLFDAQGRVVDCNQSVYRRKSGSKKDVLGRYCHELESGDFCHRKGRGCPFAQTVATGEKAEAVHTQVDSNGRVNYYRVYTYPLLNDIGELTHVVEMRRDITVRTYAEKRIQQERKMAAIGELSAYIAHEIRNPLTAIGGFARSLLRSENLGEEEQEKANIIYEESKRLDGILSSILNYSKPSDVRVDEVDLNVVAGETTQLMGIGCDSKGIDLQTRLQPGIPFGQGVPELLKQCLVNTVKNAMEAVPDGGTVRVSTGMHDKKVFVRVEDNGAGIPDEVKIRVFTPFYSTKEQGTGLGLSMTKKIVEEAGGTIQLSSREGLGTAVTILLEPASPHVADSLQGADQ